MPSTGASTEDLVRSLGLIAPLTRQNKDWQLHPAVQSLYVHGLDPLIKQYHVLSNEDIKASTELRDAAVALLNSWAPVIWGPGDRPWLMRPKDERAGGRYLAHLYWRERKDAAL